MKAGDTVRPDDPNYATGVARAILEQVRRVVIGQEYVLNRLLIGLFTGGHVLIEGVPGLAKTLIVRVFAKAINATFGRIQFTPDLLPADLIGTQIYNPRTGEFSTKRGPIFANIILADEVNRAPPKVQSALLEAMQEKQVTIGDHTLKLPEPFFVFATQNPIEQEGTYPLPEAQLDRFMMKLQINYPAELEELKILEKMGVTEPPTEVSQAVELESVLRARRAVDAVYADERIKKYVLNIVRATREPGELDEGLRRYIRYGASPRAGVHLLLAAKAHALIDSRNYVTPSDIKAVAPDVLRHRVLLSYEAEADELRPDDLISEILGAVPVP